MRQSNTRQSILEAAYNLFYRRGFSRVSVDEIADLAKVTKRTLYYHFKSKDELLASMLDFQRELAIAHIRKHEKRYSRDADDVIGILFSELARWSKRRGWAGTGFTRLVMELADLPGHPARAIALRHKAEVENWYAELLSRANVFSPSERARELALLLEGATALILISGDRSYADTAARAAKRLARNVR
jgi:AcrR family transcriptional regulator